MRFSSAKHGLLSLSAFIVFAVCGGCAVEAAKSEASPKPAEPAIKKASTIAIPPNSPADTVRVFYKNLREGKFREAIFLTNLRPAIEGLTDAELKDFQVDLDALARNVPADVQINGEIVTADKATVTVKVPENGATEGETQQVRLRKDGDVWVILTVEESEEKNVKAEGKNYFYSLRIKAHEEDAREMLNRVAKAQMVYSSQNKGLYADMETLVGAGWLPADIKTGDSTGYVYKIVLTPDRKSYTARAVPVAYGKTGKLSFFVELEGAAMGRLTSKDDPAAKLD